MLLNWSLLIVAAVAQSAAPTKPTNPPVRSPGAVTAFVNVSVIPMDREQVLANQTVLVRGEQITKIGPANQVAVPAGAVRIDGRGKFLLPGLGDMHMHLFLSHDIETGDEHNDWYVEPKLFCYLANGVTAIRNMNHSAFLVGLQDRIAKGKVLGPRIYFADGNDFRYQTSIPSSAKNASIEHLQGYLEALVSSDTSFHFDQIPRSYHDYQLLVWDSLLSVPTFTQNLDESKIPAIAAATQRAGVWNIPTQTETEHMIERWSGSTAAKTSPVIKLHRQLVKALHDAGAGLLLGTGAPAWGLDYGFAVHQELERLVASGLTPYQALETGTRNVAVFLDTLDHVGHAGTVAVGQWADLILLTANPLEDIRNTTRSAGVMVKGQWLARRGPTSTSVWMHRLVK